MLKFQSFWIHLNIMFKSPGCILQTADKGKADKSKFDWSSWNWPLPGRTTRQGRNKGRYTTDNGLYWSLVQNFLTIISDPKSGIVPIINPETKLKVFAVSSQEDGMALKPGLSVDPHQAKVISATNSINLQGIILHLQPRS